MHPMPLVVKASRITSIALTMTVGSSISPSSTWSISIFFRITQWLNPFFTFSLPLFDEALIDSLIDFISGSPNDQHTTQANTVITVSLSISTMQTTSPKIS
ncbi:hypothetical protein BDR03DRAFT_358604 [Suillus americanus]|nr:hypothetical protein BDR03DRAFT_358604 [Suillus americanus]